MNERFTLHANLRRFLESEDGSAPPHDPLDELLREWHREHADLAAASRRRTLEAVTADQRSRDAWISRGRLRPVLARIGHAMVGRTARAVACLALVATLATLVLTPARHEAFAGGVIQVPEGGELTAFSPEGDRLGPCPLQHTDVDADVSGPVTRVTVTQRYANPYPQKVEAVYTFPLSHRAAVDRMRITVTSAAGERVIEGEVKEREAARQIYEAARASGYVASLLEQERPNIFTQSVANIEPGAKVAVEISYVEFLQRTDGVYEFDFPMVVGPRYIPGNVSSVPTGLPAGLEQRAGVVLLGPAEVTITSTDSTITAQGIQQSLGTAIPIRPPTPEWLDRAGNAGGQPTNFAVTYATGAKEAGQLLADGTGQINGRFFWIAPAPNGGGFAQDTDQVPDASRITPMPVRPPERAGHDVSVRVTINTGGPAVRALTSELHEVVTEPGSRPGQTVVTLKEKSAIPNRDFILSWRADEATVTEGVLAHVRDSKDPTAGGYVAVVLNPPDRVEQDEVPPRELIFVLDTSGSMNGFPIEKAKEVMTKAIAAMRPADTFNVITFAGTTRILWNESRLASDENRREATNFVNTRSGSGGTEMMTAINAALQPQSRPGWLTPKELADLPADGRGVRVQAPMRALDANRGTLAVGDGKSLNVALGVILPTVTDPANRGLNLEGRWITEGGERIFAIERASFVRNDISPTRIVMFLTDGFVGNDQTILQAVRDNAKTTRVFSFGIGNSVNRFLLDEMAHEGRGESEIVTLAASADEAVERFTKRIQSPVLVDIGVQVDGVELTDFIPSADRIPDLYDEKPLVLLARYANPGKGTLTLRGRTGKGDWERSIPIDLPASRDGNSSVPTLWARAKLDEILAPHRKALEEQHLDPAIKNQVIALGEAYQIMSPFTSFVAVERSRVTVGGQPMLVQIPIELPEGTNWQGFFGEGVSPAQWLAKRAEEDARTVDLGIEPVTTWDFRFAKDVADLQRFKQFVPALDAEGDGLQSQHLYFIGAVTQPQVQLEAGSVWREISAGVRVVRPDGSVEAPSGGDLNGASDPAAAGGGGGFGGGSALSSSAGYVVIEQKGAASHAPPNQLGRSAGSAGADPSVAWTKDRNAFGLTGIDQLTAAEQLKRRSAGEPIAAPGAPPPAPSSPPPPAARSVPVLGDIPALHADTRTNTAVERAPAVEAATAERAKDASLSEASARQRGLSDRDAAEARKLAPASEPDASGKAVQREREDALRESLEKQTAPVDKKTDANRSERDQAFDRVRDSKELRAADELATATASAAPVGGAETTLADEQKTPPIVYTEAQRDLLVRRLEESLLILALAADVDPAQAATLAAAVRPPFDMTEKGVLVTILVTDVNGSVRERLRAAGASIEGEAPATKVIVARVRLVDLMRLALSDGVRKIEPFRAKPAGPVASDRN